MYREPSKRKKKLQRQRRAPVLAGIFPGPVTPRMPSGMPTAMRPPAPPTYMPPPPPSPLPPSAPTAPTKPPILTRGLTAAGKTLAGAAGIGAGLIGLEGRTDWPERRGWALPGGREPGEDPEKYYSESWPWSSGIMGALGYLSTKVPGLGPPALVKPIAEKEAPADPLLAAGRARRAATMAQAPRLPSVTAVQSTQPSLMPPASAQASPRLLGPQMQIMPTMPPAPAALPQPEILPVVGDEQRAINPLDVADEELARRKLDELYSQVAKEAAENPQMLQGPPNILPAWQREAQQGEWPYEHLAVSEHGAVTPRTRVSQGGRGYTGVVSGVEPGARARLPQHPWQPSLPVARLPLPEEEEPRPMVERRNEPGEDDWRARVGPGAVTGAAKGMPSTYEMLPEVAPEGDISKQSVRERATARRNARMARLTAPEDMRQMLMLSRRTGATPQALALGRAAQAVGAGTSTPAQEVLLQGPNSLPMGRLAAATEIGAGYGAVGQPLPPEVLGAILPPRQPGTPGTAPIPTLRSQLPQDVMAEVLDAQERGDIERLNRLQQLWGGDEAAWDALRALPTTPGFWDSPAYPPPTPSEAAPSAATTKTPLKRPTLKEEYTRFLMDLGKLISMFGSGGTGMPMGGTGMGLRP